MTAWMRNNLRTILALTVTLTFVIFTGCGGGGGDDAPPPPPPGAQGPDLQALQELQMKAVQMKQACVRTYAVVLMPALQQMQRRPAAVPYGQPMMGGYPGMPQQGMPPQGMPQQGMPAAPPPQQQCFDAAMNFIMSAKTMMNGQAINYPPFRQWVQAQFMGVGDRIAGVLASQGIDLINNPQLRNAALAMGSQILNTQFKQQLPADLQSMMGQALQGGGRIY